MTRTKRIDKINIGKKAQTKKDRQTERKSTRAVSQGESKKKKEPNQYIWIHPSCRVLRLAEQTTTFLRVEKKEEEKERKKKR